jgi:hypothetical protein
MGQNGKKLIVHNCLDNFHVDEEKHEHAIPMCGKTDCDFMYLFWRKSIKLSISLQFKIEKRLGGQPMLIFA